MADGLFMTPEMARQAAMEKGMLSSAQMAQLPLLNQVAAMGGNAGAMIGSSLGGLFGGRSAFELENEARMQAYQQQQAAEAEKLRQEQAYKNLLQQKIVQDMGLAAAQEKRAQTPELSTFGQLLKEQEKYQPGTPGYQAYAKRIEKEYATTAKTNPSVGAKAELYAQTEFLKPFNQLTQEERASVLKKIESKDGVSLGDGLSQLANAIGQKEMSRAQAAQTAKAITPEIVQGKEETLNALIGARELLGTPENQAIYTGGLAELKKGISKYTPLGSQEKLENTEMFQQRVRTTVIPKLKAFGGNDTEEERKFLEKLQGGEITEEWSTLDDILERAINNTRRSIARDKNTYNNIVEGKGGVDISIKEDVNTKQTVTLPDGTVVTVRKKGG